MLLSMPAEGYLRCILRYQNVRHRGWMWTAPSSSCSVASSFFLGGPLLLLLVLSLNGCNNNNTEPRRRGKYVVGILTIQVVSHRTVWVRKKGLMAEPFSKRGLSGSAASRGYRTCYCPGVPPWCPPYALNLPAR